MADFSAWSGTVTLAVVARDLGTTESAVRHSLVELAGAGLVRLAIGPDGDVPALKVSRTLTLTGGARGDAVTVLFLRPPFRSLSARRKKSLLQMADSKGPPLSLGALALLCASVAVADAGGFARHDAVEDYAGCARGALAGKTA